MPKINMKITPALLLLVFGSSLAADFDQNYAPDSNFMLSTVEQSLSNAAIGSITEFSLGNGWLADKWKGKTAFYSTRSRAAGQLVGSQWSIDITRRLLAAQKNTYLAMGLGWNDVDLTEGESSSGMRFIANGRVGLPGSLYLFGQAALSPWMADVGNLVNPYGQEVELGLALKPVPSLSLRAGYRGYWLTGANTSPDSSLRSQTDGFFIGGGLRW